MRQAGVIAAAGIVALETMVGRLAQDHENALHLAEGLNEIDGLSVSMPGVQTNLVYFRLTTDHLSPTDLVARLWEKGVRIGVEVTGLRAVTHYGIEAQDRGRSRRISADHGGNQSPTVRPLTRPDSDGWRRAQRTRRPMSARCGTALWQLTRRSDGVAKRMCCSAEIQSLVVLIVAALRSGDVVRAEQLMV